MFRLTCVAFVVATVAACSGVVRTTAPAALNPSAQRGIPPAIGEIGVFWDDSGQPAIEFDSDLAAQCWFAERNNQRTEEREAECASMLQSGHALYIDQNARFRVLSVEGKGKDKLDVFRVRLLSRANYYKEILLRADHCHRLEPQPDK